MNYQYFILKVYQIKVPYIIKIIIFIFQIIYLMYYLIYHNKLLQSYIFFIILLYHLQDH